MNKLITTVAFSALTLGFLALLLPSEAHATATDSLKLKQRSFSLLNSTLPQLKQEQQMVLPRGVERAFY